MCIDGHDNVSRLADQFLDRHQSLELRTKAALDMADLCVGGGVPIVEVDAMAAAIHAWANLMD